MGSLPYRMYDVYNKKAWSLLGARRQNLSRLRVEKLGCAGSRQIIPAISLRTAGAAARCHCTIPAACAAAAVVACAAAGCVAACFLLALLLLALLPSLALCKDSRRSLLEDTKGLGSGTNTAPAMRPAPQFRCSSSSSLRAP